MESMVQHMQCPECGLVNKAKMKEHPVVIVSHPQRKTRAVRNVPWWMQQNNVWTLAQKKE